MGITKPNALGFPLGLTQLKKAKKPLLEWGQLEEVITKKVSYFL